MTPSFASPTRRAFLTQSSLAMAGLLWARPSTARGAVIAVPMRANVPVSTFAPPVLDPEVMRHLARTAMDAAMSAGARAADIRIGDQRIFYADGGLHGRLEYHCGYGVRAEVDGMMAFVGGADPTPEAVVRAARSAVATARGLAKIVGAQPPLPAVPVVTGEWKATLEIDPFSVAPEDHAFVLTGLTKINTISGPTGLAGAAAWWQNETRVFASSEGSLITQTLADARPFLSMSSFSPDPRQPRLGQPVSFVSPGTVGFEILLGTELQARIDAAIRDFDTWRSYPVGDPEIGRKEVVLDGWTTGMTLGNTLLPALSLARVLGDEQDINGTSFLTPPEQVLGQTLFAPTLNVNVVTGPKQYGARQWDDDGVTQRSVSLIHEGRVANYLTARANVAMLPQAELTGTERAEQPTSVPMTCAGAVAMDAAANGPTLAEMVKSVKDGVLVRAGWADANQQNSGGVIAPTTLFKIRNGVITHRVVDATVEFSARKLWKELVAIGHPSTTETILYGQYGGVPIASTHQSITAPALHLNKTNVFSLL